MTITLRTAAAGARLAHPGVAGLRGAYTPPLTSTGPAYPADVALACMAAGQPDLAASMIRSRATMQAVHATLAADPPDQGSPPSNPDPVAEPTADERLAVLESTVADHEARLTRIEGEMKPALPEPPPAAPEPAAEVNTAAIYARLNTAGTGGRAQVRHAAMQASAAPGKAVPADAPRLDARAVYARMNAVSN